jgi:thiol-disulfide isomerase/thioredoxin
MLIASLLSLCPDVEQLVRSHQAESTLLNRQVPVRRLSRFDYRGGDWTEQSIQIQPGQIVLLHLWAVECKPCLHELPVLTPLLNGLRTNTRVQVLFLAETASRDRLQQFLLAHRSELPSFPHYQISTPELREALGVESQPLTLLLDSDLTVRQTFVGSLTGRREELLSALDRLQSVRPTARRSR